MISSGLFTSDTCNVDATCLPHTEKYQSAVVQISHPVLLNFCTGTEESPVRIFYVGYCALLTTKGAAFVGTLIQGPASRVFVLSARHCVAVRRTGFVYPWSSFVLIFNYKLPCGADRVDNVTASFSSYLQVGVRFGPAFELHSCSNGARCTPDLCRGCPLYSSMRRVTWLFLRFCKTSRRNGM